MKRKKMRPVRGWVGVSSDKLDLEAIGGYGVVYKTRREALLWYMVVRRVVVRVI